MVCQGVTPPAQLLKVPTGRVPLGSSRVRRRGCPAAGPEARIGVFAEMRRLYLLSSTSRQALPVFSISTIEKPCAAMDTSLYSRVYFAAASLPVMPGQTCEARWFSWLTPSRPRVELLE